MAVPRRSEVFNEQVKTRTSRGLPGCAGNQGQQPAAFSPDTDLFYVPTNHVCMDYEPFKVNYTAGQPYVGATLSMYPPPGEKNMGNFIAWDARNGKIVWSSKEQFSVWSGALATAGNVVFYGTLEGYLKAVDAKTGKELYKFKTPSGIIGNVTTYEHNGKQYVAVLSGVGGWAGIGLAAGLTDPTAGLGAVGGYAGLARLHIAGWSAHGVLAAGQLKASRLSMNFGASPQDASGVIDDCNWKWETEGSRLLAFLWRIDSSGRCSGLGLGFTSTTRRGGTSGVAMRRIEILPGANRHKRPSLGGVHFCSR